MEFRFVTQAKNSGGNQLEINVDLSSTEPTLLKAGPPKEMISVREDGNKTFVKINSSSIGIIQECLRKAQYSLHEKWRIETEHPATVFGSAIHKALEVFYTGEMSERKLPSLDDMELMSYGHKVPNEETDLLLKATRAFIEKAKPLESIPPEDKRSIQNGVWILHNYFKSFINDPYIAYVDESGPFLERTFTYRIYEDPYLIVDIFGTIDFAFKHIENGNVLCGDHKTTSSLNFNDQSYFDRERPNHQYTLYSLGAQRVFGIKSNEFMVNVVEVKAKPKTSRGSAPHFPRQLTYRDEEDFIEVKDVVMKTVRDYLNARKNEVWPLGPIGACTSYGSCTYRQVCTAPKSLRETILNSKFRREADVTKRD